MRVSIVACSLVWLIMAAAGQRPPSPYYEDTNGIPLSPQMQPYGRVTFHLFAPKASEVVRMGPPGILEVLKEPKLLRADDTGIWSLTVGPLPPGFYTYGYAIDGGLRLPDPSNPNLELRHWDPASIFILLGSEIGIFTKRSVLHGTLQVNFYDYRNLGAEKKVKHVFYELEGGSRLLNRQRGLLYCRSAIKQDAPA